MKISSNISYTNNTTNKQINSRKTLKNNTKNDMTFNGKLMTRLRLNALDRFANDQMTKSNGWGILTRFLVQVSHFKMEFNELDAIKDKNGNVSRGVYKICKNLIKNQYEHSNYVIEALNKLKNQDGLYDENSVKKANKLPRMCSYLAPDIIKKTKDLPEDMQKEIFKFFPLYKRRCFDRTKIPQIYHINDDILFEAITDKNKKINMTLIKAMKAITKTGGNIRELCSSMSTILDLAYYGKNYRPGVYKRYSKMLKSEGITIEDVGFTRLADNGCERIRKRLNRENEFRTRIKNLPFADQVLSYLRLKNLERQYHSNEYDHILSETQKISFQMGLKAIDISGLSTELDFVRDKDGKVPKDVYKICKNLLNTEEDYNYIWKYLKNFRNQNGFYDKSKLKMACELPKKCYGMTIHIIENTENLPENMRKEIFKIFQLADKRDFVPTSDLVFSSITDHDGKYNMTLIKAVQALVKDKRHCMYDDNAYFDTMNHIISIAGKCGYKREQERVSKIFRKAGLTLDEVANAKKGTHI